MVDEEEKKKKKGKAPRGGKSRAVAAGSPKEAPSSPKASPKAPPSSPIGEDDLGLSLSKGTIISPLEPRMMFDASAVATVLGAADFASRASQGIGKDIDIGEKGVNALHKRDELHPQQKALEKALFSKKKVGVSRNYSSQKEKGIADSLVPVAAENMDDQSLRQLRSGVRRLSGSRDRRDGGVDLTGSILGKDHGLQEHHHEAMPQHSKGGRNLRDDIDVLMSSPAPQGDRFPVENPLLHHQDSPKVIPIDRLLADTAQARKDMAKVGSSIGPDAYDTPSSRIASASVSAVAPPTPPLGLGTGSHGHGAPSSVLPPALASYHVDSATGDLILPSGARLSGLDLASRGQNSPLKHLLRDGHLLQDVLHDVGQHKTIIFADLAHLSTGHFPPGAEVVPLDSSRSLGEQIRQKLEHEGIFGNVRLMVSPGSRPSTILLDGQEIDLGDDVAQASQDWKDIDQFLAINGGVLRVVGVDSGDLGNSLSSVLSANHLEAVKDASSLEVSRSGGNVVFVSDQSPNLQQVLTSLSPSSRVFLFSPDRQHPEKVLEAMAAQLKRANIQDIDDLKIWSGGVFDKLSLDTAITDKRGSVALDEIEHRINSKKGMITWGGSETGTIKVAALTPNRADASQPPPANVQDPDDTDPSAVHMSTRTAPFYYRIADTHFSDHQVVITNTGRPLTPADALSIRVGRSAWKPDWSYGYCWSESHGFSRDRGIAPCNNDWAKNVYKCVSRCPSLRRYLSGSLCSFIWEYKRGDTLQCTVAYP